MNPEKINKYLYISKTPTALIRGFYLFGIFAWLLDAYVFLLMARFDWMYRWFFLPMISFFTVYLVFSYGLNLFYRRFDLQGHLDKVTDFWRSNREPSVDVFLPICGEDMEILKNTWHYVSKLDYTNIKVYVLDDSRNHCKEHAELAATFGFEYFERPNKGEMKKAGNLKHAYQQTHGDFIVIFDADFAPNKDFLKELLPYMADEKIGIVQSPQYFELSHKVHKRSVLEYGASHRQECFYRYIQVARDRFGATVCCGTNAIYRRKALDVIGGTVQAGHSEDQRTGFALQCNGWVVRYVPVVLAVGLSPDGIYALFHQRHRWCAGNIELMLKKDFWTAPVSWKSKVAYATGFAFYLHHPLSLIFSFQLFWILFNYNDSIRFGGGLFFYPYLIFTIAYLFFFQTEKFRWGNLYVGVIELYAYTHAIFTSIFSKPVAWVATGAKHSSVSAAFKQAIGMAFVYLGFYLTLVALAVHRHLLHIFDYNYLPIQFWMFYHIGFAMTLLWGMYKYVENNEVGTIQQKNALSLTKTQSTAAVCIISLFAWYCAIVYL